MRRQLDPRFFQQLGKPVAGQPRCVDRLLERPVHRDLDPECLEDRPRCLANGIAAFPRGLDRRGHVVEGARFDELAERIDLVGLDHALVDEDGESNSDPLEQIVNRVVGIGRNTELGEDARDELGDLALLEHGRSGLIGAGARRGEEREDSREQGDEQSAR